MTFLLTCCLALAAADDATPEALVAKLGAEAFAEREAAGRDLEALGPRALEALRRASQTGDLEVRRRARELVRKIERSQETAKLLEPSRFTLSCRGVRLEAAAADLSRLSGTPIKVVGQAALRKVTLEAEKVTFWEAVEKLCEAGEVAEVPPSPPPPAQNENVSSASMTVFGRRGMVPTPSDILRVARTERPPELVLTSGKAVAAPTHHLGAVRVRALPPSVTLPDQPLEPGEVMVVLDVAAEGRLQWHRAAGLRLDRALDAEGRPLTARPARYKPAVSSRSGVVINGMPLDPEPDEPGASGRLVPVRLKPSEGTPKRLKELAGRVVGQLRTPFEPLVEVDRILEASGKTVRGKNAGVVRVVEVEKEEDTLVRVRVMVEPAPRGLTPPQVLPFAGRIVVNGRVVSADTEDLLSSWNFALLDAKGKPFRVTHAISTGRRDGSAAEYELSYAPERGQAAAAKFVYSDRRTVFLEVPFVLRDVPLAKTE